MKKVLTICLCVLLLSSFVFLVSTVNISTANAAAATFEIKNDIAEIGTEFSVPISIKNNSGIISLRFSIIFDEDVLELVKVKNTGLLKGYTTPSSEKKSPYTLRWADSLSDVNNASNGEVAIVTFKVKKSVQLKETTVTVDYTEARTGSGEKVNFVDITKKISLTKEHSFSVYVSDNNATCSDNGTKTAFCDYGCGKTHTVENAGSAYGHNMSGWIKNNDGTHTRKCQRTNCVYSENESCSYGSFVTTKKATCTAAGSKQRTCSVCNAVETATIAKLGHSYYSSYTVDKKATCTDAGSKSKHCTRSGCTAKTSVTTIAKLAHTYDNACDKTCNVCSATRTITHSYTTTTTKATLSKSGSIKTACTVCGNVKSNKTISYPKTFTLSATSYTYNGYVKTPTVTVKDANGNVLTKGTDYTVTYAEGRKNVGTYKVTVKMIGNYSGTKTLSFKIKPVDISKCTVKLSATNLTYNGKVRTPVVTVTNANGVKLTKDTHYTVTYASGRKNVGTYNVKVTMKGNYTGTKTLSFKIKPVDISKCTVKLSATSLTYNGKVRTPIVSIVNPNGAKLTKDTHYTVTYASGRKNVGTYNVKVTMKGNYTGTKTLSFKIKPVDISKCTVSLSSTSYSYDGNVKAPTVTVKNASGTKLTKGTSYTVTYASGRKNVGTYKVTVTMKGNYTGTKTLTFKINPPKTTIASLKAGTKSITVNLNKKTTQTTGYQIQYSTNKDFTNAKTKTVTSNSTVKTTLSSLTAGKTYYVRVRTYKTVNDVKYYSGWSAYKYVKIK